MNLKFSITFLAETLKAVNMEQEKMRNKLSVTLDKTVFSPGEVIHGSVLVNLIESVQVKSLFARVRGVAKVHWVQLKDHGQSQHYQADIDLIKLQDDIWRKERKGKSYCFN